jgi:hypothetical protein
MKRRLFFFLLSSVFFLLVPVAHAQNVSLATRTDINTPGILGADLVGVEHGNVWYKWTITEQTAYWNSTLGFWPVTTTVPTMLAGTPLAGQYGGTGLNVVGNTGLPFVTSGVWSLLTNVTMPGNLTVGATATFTAPHILGNAGVTTSNFTHGTGAGTGGTITVTPDSGATDMSGVVTLLTGTTPATGTTVFTLTFSQAFTGNPPHALICPCNAAAASLALASRVYPTTTLTTLVINPNTSALAATTTYVWSYFVAQ